MTKFVDTLVRDLVGSDDALTNHVGVEIELEHENAPEGIPTEVSRYWRVENDGSLRKNGLEYVLKKPLTEKTANTAVKLLGRHVDNTNKVVDAGRAGIHVHVNVGDLTVCEMMNFISVCHIIEDVLVNWCGPRRVGNLFCLRVKDAEYVIDLIKKMLLEENLRVLHTDNIRYSSINLKAIYQYGSIEFRAMRSDGDWEAINIWIGTLLRLKEVAKRLDSPAQIVSDMSNVGPSIYIDQLLGPYAKYFNKYLGFDVDIFNSVRRVQEYAFTKDWG